MVNDGKYMVNHGQSMVLTGYSHLWLTMDNLSIIENIHFFGGHENILAIELGIATSM